MDNYNRRGGMMRFSLMPPMIKGLIVANVLVFVFEYLLQLGAYNIDGYPLEFWFRKLFYLIPINLESGNPAYYHALENAHFYIWQLITYQFIHGGFWHIALNMFALWMFGAELESIWGSKKFIIFYLICGVGAGLVQLGVQMFPELGPPLPTVGASGAIFGVLVAFGMTFPDRPIFMFPLFIPIPAKFFVIIYAVIALISGFTSTGNVANFAHVGGAIFGFLLIKLGDRMGIYDLFRRKTRSTYDTSHTTGYSHEPRIYSYSEPTSTPSAKFESSFTKKTQPTITINGEEITQLKIDEILDKISASGYQNLTDREKKILFELSQKLK
jgi:membrane associated rhomboid family serine protease